jgi:hypothetical protein
MKSEISQSKSDEAIDFMILLFTGDAQGRPCARLLSSQVYAALVTIEYHESRLVFVSIHLCSRSGFIVCVARCEFLYGYFENLKTYSNIARRGALLARSGGSALYSMKGFLWSRCSLVVKLEDS